VLNYENVNIVERMLDEADNKDAMVKYLIENADFEIAYYLVCKYITKRSVQYLHKSIIANISSNKSTLDLAPRGFGKSTVGDVDYCITKILRDPNIRIMIGSKTQTQAQAFLKEIRTHFEQNVDLLRVFGDWKTSKDTVWSDREFTVNRRTIIKKEATVTALGASGAVISKHFDVIIGDDLVGLENARTEHQRANLKEWFYSSLFPTLEPDGEIHILGTRYNPLDLYEDLMKSGSYVVNIQQAIRLVEGKEVSLWEDKFTLERLKQIRADSGKIIFNMQYQNDTELAKGKIFKAKYFRYYEEYKIDYDFQKAKVKVKNADGIESWIPVRVYFGCDLAISERENDNNDYFVCMVIGVDADKNVYVLEYVKERYSFNTQLNAIIQYGREKYPMVERIGVETVAYQKSLAQELRRLSLLPIININTSKDKVTRAMRRSANFENGKIWFREGMDDLEECLLLFPEVDHDDLFDGLDFACAMADNNNEIIVHSREDFYI
jgi:predicted phage terminase large subunit-like protein